MIKSDLKRNSEIKPAGSDSTKDLVVDNADIDLIFSPGHMADVDCSLKDPVVDNTAKDVVVDETLKDPVAHDPTKDTVVSDSEKKPSRYRSKPKKKKERILEH